uniref:Phosphoribosyl-ATP pyrophosphohydrolase n=1 Tax=viral metagenome TaxID=1070528 RepID=A0A6C0CB28_9ZZZZ
MASNFEKVINFNTQFGVMKPGSMIPNREVLSNDPALVDQCMKLIREEMKELEAAVKDKDITEVVDGLGDILYVVYGMAARMGFDIDYGFNLIHENNMSKLCTSEEQAQQTVQKYKDEYDAAQLLISEGRSNMQVYDSPTYRQAPDGVHWVVYNKTTNKVLKSIAWKQVDLSSVLVKTK